MHDLTRYSTRALEVEFEENNGDDLPGIKRLHAELVRRRSRRAMSLEARVSARITELEARVTAANLRRKESTIVLLSGELSRGVVAISGELRLIPDSLDQKSLSWKLRAIRPDGEIVDKSDHIRCRSARDLLADLRLFLHAADVHVPLSELVRKIAEQDDGFAQQLEAAIADAGLSAAEPYPRKDGAIQRPWWLLPHETLASLTD